MAVSLSAQAPADECARTWTFGPNGETRRDGAHVGGGFGLEYRCHGGTVYVLGGADGRFWYQWTGSAWLPYGLEPAAVRAVVGVRVTLTATHAGPVPDGFRWLLNGVASGADLPKTALVNGVVTTTRAFQTPGTYVVALEAFSGTQTARSFPPSTVIVTAGRVLPVVRARLK